MTLLIQLLALCGLALCDPYSFIHLPETDLSLLGPIYLPVNNFSSSAFQDAAKTVKSAIDDALATGNSTFSPFDNVTTSFAASVYDLNTGESIWDYYWAGPELKGSLSKGALTEDTIFRSGSLGKLFTVYTWLVDIGDDVWFDPITKYIVSISYSSWLSLIMPARACGSSI
jgi:hypothetical protein